MKIRKFIKAVVIPGILLCLPYYCMAQATMGDKKAPEPFSVLELISNDYKRGLRLPQLTAVQRDALSVGGKTEAAGLVIFNTDTDCVEYWNGTEWVQNCGMPYPEGVVVSPVYNTYATGIDLFTGAEFSKGLDNTGQRGTGFLYTNVEAGYFRYSGAKGQSLPAVEFKHESGLKVVIDAQTLNGTLSAPASGSIAIKVSGIPSSAYAGKAFDIPIKYLGQNLKVRVSIGCGAYTGDKSAVYADGTAVNWVQSACS